jgi:glycosyltransferase involved in cell wall biosynthesis
VLPQFGVDVDAMRPSSAPRPDRPFTIGYAGRLVPAKGVDLLLTAAARLTGQPVEVRLAGDGPARAELTALSRRLGGALKVRFLGWVEPERLPDFYRGLDVFVLPSRSTPGWTEQFGRVLVEAMACGVPCAGSRSGEIPAVLGDAGLTFAEGATGELAEVLVRLAHDPEKRSELARKGRARAVSRFASARVAAETAAIYRQVAGEPGAEPLTGLGPAV